MYIPVSNTSTLQRGCSPAAAPDAPARQMMLSLKLHQHQQQVRARHTPPPPPIVRKDSGEIVRSCLRRRSAATGSAASSRCPSPARVRTPRFVHFGTDLERVRWFLKAQSPQAVCEDAVLDDERREPWPTSAGQRAPRAETVRLVAIQRPAPSFAAFEAAPVVVEQVVLADARRAAAVLRGSIKVHNLAFEKDVTVRYTLDGWRTVHEVPAAYSRMLAAGQSDRPSVDRFEFSLPLPAGALAGSLPATLALCARYRVAGAEHWDNNCGSNYSFRIAQPAAPAIADDDCDAAVVVAAPACTASAASEGLRAPRRLTFSDAGSSRGRSRDAAELARFAAPTAADTRRYMAQSAALFGARPAPMHAMQTELPLFRDMAWGGITDALSCAPSPSPPSAASYPVFDADGAVRSGSPLAWMHSQTTQLQC
ncbi:hypothetical protein IWQ56_004403 [Coemansia nantahalensis]|uniref:Uncharacterized protein n=2 Tax=Coemansia TaxID=4863 RepID=A0ACC1JZ44_9FUNG